ncbi:MAG TPA: TIGR03435 family protein [Bryobacteraceae bacterium]|jgi:uncharacterized protein (TIGR03435 family)
MIRATAGVIVLMSSGLVGQSTAARPAFEVVSVKPTPPERQNRLRYDYCPNGGRFFVSGTPVMWSLAYAYHLKELQITGALAWLSAFDSAYDIEGKPASPVTDEQCRLMVQSLFADRFKLAAHMEMKESPVYLLTIGKNGTKLREGGGVKLNGSVQVDASGKPDWADGWTASQLAGYLAEWAGRPVVDRTGLTGRYGVTLDFSRKDGDDRPSVFTAVQEQLGLKLDAGKAPIEMLVVDHIEKPGDN